MKIAVNTRLLIKNKLEGIGWVTYETLKRITRNHPEHEFYFIFDRKYDESYLFSDNIEPVVLFPQARHPVLYYTWFELSMPGLLNKIKPDLFFSPDGYLSLSTRIPSVNMFHDLNFEHYPKDLPWHERFYYRTFFPKYARKAKRIATVSEYSKQDIVKQYGVSPQKIDVVYNGANDRFKPVGEETVNSIRKKYTDGEPYFIFVGALHPRKNLVNLFAAFDKFKKEKSTGIKLLIVGEKMWWTNQIANAYETMEFKEEVVFSGRLAIEELYKVLGAALALTYVSYFEGFGIPIVEAFKAGVPVITSNVSSMPEVAGDHAALLVDPFSVNSICEAMMKISEDVGLREKLISEGFERQKQFSWDQSARKLWETLEKAQTE